MFKKGELTTQQIVILIVLVASFAIILFFIFRLNLGQETSSEICHNSVVMRGKSIIPTDLKCQREYVCLSADGSCKKMTKPKIIKVKTKDDVYKALADQLAQCWWMFGEGKVDYIGRDLSPKNYCSICSQIAFDKSVYKIFDNKNFSKKDFYNFLSKTKMSNGKTYQNYFLLNGIFKYKGNFGKVDLTKQYYSLIGITSKVNKLGWALGGAAILGTIAAIPLTGGFSVIALGTLSGGIAVGGATGWIASSMFLVPTVKGPSGNYFIPPSLIKVNSKEFDALKCASIETSG